MTVSTANRQLPNPDWYMRRALRLAARAQGRTAPNPMVGSVVVANGDIVGEGYHRRAGEPHAEVNALRAAGHRSRGGTLYVTLEPCCHHGRTPPCTDAILAAGVRRVVAAMQDPFPKVSGGGFAILRQAGIDVQSGVLEAEARALNRAYLKVVETGLPWVTLKMAMTLDGKIATRTGDSRWITGEPARRYVHRLRDRHDAVLIGIGTARADDPLLTARVRGARNPVRVVVDTRAELPRDSMLAATARETPTWIVTAAGHAAADLAEKGVEVLQTPTVGTRIDLEAALRELVRRNLHSVLCEGGAELSAALLEQGLVDEVLWFIAPKLVGGRKAPGPVGGEGAEKMAGALELADVRYQRIGSDLLIRGYINKKS